MKTCARCKEDKPRSEFNKASKQSKAKDGLYPYCKPCNSKNKLEYYKKHPEKIKAQRVKWRRKGQYGLTNEDYDRLLESQNNSCKICGDSFEEVRTDIDHCHSTNKVRGLLCNKCNTGIGLFRENISFLLSAVDYLRSHQ